MDRTEYHYEELSLPNGEKFKARHIGYQKNSRGQRWALYYAPSLDSHIAVYGEPTRGSKTVAVIRKSLDHITGAIEEGFGGLI